MAQDTTERGKGARDARLRAALRDNLKKRKLQEREARADDPPEAKEPPKD